MTAEKGISKRPNKSQRSFLYTLWENKTINQATKAILRSILPLSKKLEARTIITMATS